MSGSRKEDFDRLALAHFHELRRVALRVCEDRETADDLVQETYLRAWRSFDKFEPGTNCRAANQLFPLTLGFIQKLELREG